MYSLFIDDERFPPTSTEIQSIVRSSRKAIEYVECYGVPEFISFDHDLGGEDTAMIFIDWLIQQLLDGNQVLPTNFSFTVHSQNPVGKANIEGKLNSFLKELRNV